MMISMPVQAAITIEPDTWNPLRQSCQQSQAEVFTACFNTIPSGVNRKDFVNQVDQKGLTLLYYAAAVGGNIEIVKQLLGVPGIDIDYINKSVPFYERTALMQSAFRGFTDVVAMLCENKASVDMKNKEGETALKLAAQAGHANVVKVLCKNGADVSQTDTDGETVLMVAASAGHADVVAVLCDEKGIDIDSEDNTGNTALMLAVNGKYVDVVKVLCEKNADLQIKNNTGETALISAVSRQSVPVVKVLAEAIKAKGLNIDEQEESFFKRTALMVAVNEKNAQIVQLLLDNGADPNLVVNNGFETTTALKMAKEKGNKKILKIFEDLKEAKKTPEQKEAETKKVQKKAAEAKAAAGAKKAEKVTEGLTIEPALWEVLEDMCRTFATTLESFKEKFDKITDDKLVDFVNQSKTKDSITLLESAFENKPEIAQYILERICVGKVDVNRADLKGRTPLMWASGAASSGRGIDSGGSEKHSARYSDIVTKLLAQGADVNQADENGRTALMYAMSMGCGNIVTTLCEKGAGVDRADNDGKTALMFAACVTYNNKWLEEVVAILCKKGADVNEKDKKGKTALMYAADRGKIDVARVLCDQKEITIDLTDNDGNTALLLAVNTGFKDMTDLLREKIIGAKKAREEANKKSKEKKATRPAMPSTPPPSIPLAKAPKNKDIEDLAGALETLSKLLGDLKTALETVTSK